MQTAQPSTTARITTPFDRASTALDVVRGVDLRNKRAIVTGAASGIGVETARALASAGASVVLAVRDVAAGERVAADIRASTKNERVSVAALDLASRESIARFVQRDLALGDPLHMLVNNAGVMACPLARTAEGWEMQFATNHLGHFALAVGLLPSLKAAGNARVVSVSSVAHLNAGIDFDDIHFNKRPYDKWIAYGQSKTANVLFAVEATKRWASAGITVNALMPGAIVSNLQRHVDPAELDALRARLGSQGAFWKTAEQGAATSVLLATSPLVEGVGRRYFEDCNEAVAHVEGTRRGVAAHALDPAAAARLWEVSEKHVF